MLSTKLLRLLLFLPQHESLAGTFYSDLDEAATYCLRHAVQKSGRTLKELF